MHPWESGCDDSPRWDDTCPGGWTAGRWKAHKGDLVASLSFGADGAPATNPEFDVASVGFNALVAFCALELSSTVADEQMASAARDLAQLVSSRWDDTARTWVDAGDAEDGSGRVRTLDATLALLVDETPDRARVVADQILDPAAFGSPWGPAGVHRAEPTFDPVAYWRGPVWPQLCYLVWVALRARGLTGEARAVAAATVAGAEHSGLAEYWDPETGRGLGAIPQSWATLAVVMASAG